MEKDRARIYSRVKVVVLRVCIMMVRHDVMVLPIVFEITRVSNGDLVIHNKSPEEIDLGGFSLGLGRAFKFSRYTFVKAGGLLTVPRERIQGISGLISLLDTEGVVVAYEKATTPKHISNEYTTLTKPAPQALLSKEHSVSDFKKNDSTPEMMASVAEASQPSQETVIHIGSQMQKSEQGL
jgi:hypothetical protein